MIKIRYVQLIIILFSVGFFLLPKDSYALYKIEKEVSGSITVPENNYCINHGFNKLSDCMLVMENYATSTEDAKSYIESKGIPDFSKIAPQITYRETTTEMSNPNGVISTTAHFTLGSSYTFNESTGRFTLTNYTNDPLTEEYLDYYTCGGTNSSSTSCATMYQIKEFTTTTNDNGDVTYRVTKAIRHTYNTGESFGSEVGLYAASDDLGTSYYYRGNVLNNYVSYGGYIWRIIRQNGNGTIRMIYSGTSTSDTGSATSIGISAYNPQSKDPTYVGYKYSENFSIHETENASTSFNQFHENVNYYFGQGYEFDEDTKTFNLTGEMLQGMWSEVAEEAIESYPYTCFDTSSTGTCTVLLNVTGYQNAYTAIVIPISYSSNNYEEILENTTDSTIKERIDSWYEQNLLNKTDENGVLWSEYLSDEVFCNDRSIASGSGYLISPATYFSSYNRLYTNKIPTLSCSQASDRFTVDPSKGNGELEYPIALITADEASMAGGVYNVTNTEYYLYTGQTYWTFSPSSFASWMIAARVWNMGISGELAHYQVFDYSSVRPVISLKANLQIAGGDGSAINPYVVTLSNKD